MELANMISVPMSLIAVIKEKERESGKQARLPIMELANMISFPKSLIAVIKLNIPDIIWQGGANTPLSAPQIAAMITTTKSTADPCNLERILRLLASYCVFEEHSDGSSKRKYSLTQVGKTLVTDEQGISFGPYVLQHHQEALVQLGRSFTKQFWSRSRSLLSKYMVFLPNRITGRTRRQTI